LILFINFNEINFMYLDRVQERVLATIGLSSLTFGGVGMIGACMIRPLFDSFSPLKTAVSCALIPTIAVSVFAGFAKHNPVGAAIAGCVLAYPSSVIICNLAGMQIGVLQPAIALTVGTIGAGIIAATTIAALACLGISASFVQIFSRN
jgi:hypothetical protein